MLQRVLAFQSNDFLCRLSCYHKANPDLRWQCDMRDTSADMCRKVSDLAWSPAMEETRPRDEEQEKPYAYIRGPWVAHVEHVPSDEHDQRRTHPVFTLGRHEVLEISNFDPPLVIGRMVYLAVHIGAQPHRFKTERVPTAASTAEVEPRDSLYVSLVSLTMNDACRAMVTHAVFFSQ